MFTTTKTTEGFDKEVTEDLNQETAEGFIQINMTKATKGLRVKL